MVSTVRKLVLKGSLRPDFHLVAQSLYDCHLTGVPTWLCPYDVISNYVVIVIGYGEKKIRVER